MTDQGILNEVVKKAEKNGYRGIESIQLFMIEGLTNGEYLEIKKQLIIFSHEFAKAYWGEELCEVYPSEFRKKGFEARVDKSTMWWNMPLWEYHLQQMVLEKEPLKYLEKFL